MFLIRIFFYGFLELASVNICPFEYIDKLYLNEENILNNFTLIIEFFYKK